MSPKPLTTPPVVEPQTNSAAAQESFWLTHEEAYQRILARVRQEIADGRAQPMPCRNPTHDQVTVELIEQLVTQGVPLDQIRIPGMLRNPIPIPEGFNDPSEEFSDYM